MPWPAQRRALLTLSGPEGGLSRGRGSGGAGRRVSSPPALGARVLRADTAPLAVLAWIALKE